MEINDRSVVQKLIKSDKKYLTAKEIMLRIISQNLPL
jgi:hypothetical protein